MTSVVEETSSFQSLGLAAPVLQALDLVGYENPSPIQAQCIPHLLQGEDLLGQAQTGTGKTAAFALPLLSGFDLKNRRPQLLVLAPTRELAVQVSEAFQKYAHFMDDFHVMPIYGGQPYTHQLRLLKRGVHAVVGTPGRVMDHIRRGSLKLDQLRTLVLDEADEMLRMGFIDDVEWILEQTPKQRQIALFSATMPNEIRRVAQRHLRDPQEVRIQEKTTTAKTIRQRYWQVSGTHKLDALTRILEAEEYSAVLVFVRTKKATEELAEKLAARGYSSSALNGDIPQQSRERTVERLKRGQLDILVATDVAARGLDVERISHVINYDIPYDTESYVHRIGRTGRAGRSGEAILFVAPRERNMLRAIERATKQPIEAMQLPSTKAINEQRLTRFKQRIKDTLEAEDLTIFQQLVDDFQQESDADPLKIAAALACMAQGDEPLLLKDIPPARQQKKPGKREWTEKNAVSESRPAREKRSGRDGKRETNFDKKGRERNRDDERFSRPRSLSHKAESLKNYPEIDMERFRVEVGRQHGVAAKNLVGAIANEADIESCYIGTIEIFDDFSVVDLPEGMPKATFRDLKKAWVCGKQLEIKSMEKSSPKGSEGKPKMRKKKPAKQKPSTHQQKQAKRQQA